MNIDDVVSSAVAVTGEGEDLAAAHQGSDARMAAASTGWRGASAAALSAKMDTWATTSTVLLGRMSDHAQGLHGAAQGFSSNEDQSAGALRDVAGAPTMAPSESA
ncbi:WXG100 family type VII secretion target [Mycolicibacterium aichiense]|uniref:WXG100 family type VII secretion target n=1 Tax=Mycolicibacterium aichiense TaxID=1799 RepID=UPI003D677140